MNTNNWRCLKRNDVPLTYVTSSEVDRRLISNIDLKNKRVLNVGSGCYWITENFLLSLGANVFSLDINQSLLNILKKNVHGKIKTICADARDIPFKNNYFDMVVSFSVIEHIKNNRQRAIKEMIRVLKPGGHIAITVPNKLFLPGTLFSSTFEMRTGEYEYRYLPSELRNIIENQGIQIIKFDSSTPTVIDDVIIDERLPNFINRFPKKFMEMLLKVTNLCPFKSFGARMGYLGRKI